MDKQEIKSKCPFGYIGKYPNGGSMYNIGDEKSPCITGQAGWDMFLVELDKQAKVYTGNQ